jgi:hypothetical protein
MRRNGFEDTSVISCPVKESAESSRLFWMWYAESDKPLVFMESDAHLGVGTSLSLADYQNWKQHPVSIPNNADDNFCKQSVPLKPLTDMPAGCYGCHGGNPSTKKFMGLFQ